VMSKARILIVDDDPDVLDILQLLLEQTYDVSVARNGTEAIHLATRERFDVLLLDLMMPVVDGGEVVKELKAHGVTTPVVLISAASDLKTRARQLDVFDAESKPIDAARLEQKLQRAIASSGGSGSKPPTGGGPSSGAPGGTPVRKHHSAHCPCVSPNATAEGGSHRLGCSRTEHVKEPRSGAPEAYAVPAIEPPDLGIGAESCAQGPAHSIRALDFNLCTGLWMVPGWGQAVRATAVRPACPQPLG
jgi:CheY-like chemotaxis protein